MLKGAFEILMGFIKNLTTGFAAWLMKLFGRQQALSILVIAGMSLAITAFYTAVSVLLGQMFVAFPSGGIFQGFLYMVIPPILSKCLTAIGTFYVAKKTYEWAAYTLEAVK